MNNRGHTMRTAIATMAAVQQRPPALPPVPVPVLRRCRGRGATRRGFALLQLRRQSDAEPHDASEGSLFFFQRPGVFDPIWMSYSYIAGIRSSEDTTDKNPREKCLEIELEFWSWYEESSETGFF